MNKKKFWITNQINANTAQILIYGYISPYEINSADFLIDLTTLASKFSTVQIRINSGGGSVFEGIAIRSAIRSFIKAGKTIECYIDGIAASMAAPIAIAGVRVFISKFGRMMFHNVSGYGEGTAEDLRRTAEMMDNTEKDIMQMIADKTGMTTDDVKEKLFQPGVDKWLSAQECIDMKLADEIFDAEEVAVPQNITGTKDLVNLFDTVLNKTTITKNTTMKKELLQQLGLPENATQEQIDAAVEKSLKDKSTAENTLATQAKKTVEALVDQAITDKKLVAADKEGWVASFENNPEGLKMALGKLQPAVKAKDLISPQNRVTTGAPELDETDDDDAEKVKGGWDALVAKGMKAVDKLRNENREEYDRLYKEKYGRNSVEMGFRKEN